MSAGIARKGGKKNRKWSRFKLKCDSYRRSHRREINKLRRLRRHLKAHSNDHVAVRCAAGLEKIV